MDRGNQCDADPEQGAARGGERHHAERAGGEGDERVAEHVAEDDHPEARINSGIGRRRWRQTSHGAAITVSR